MKLIVFRLLPILIAGVMLLSVSCSGQTMEKTADLGQEVNLQLGQTVSIEGEPLKVKFVEIVSDSRCPNGAICIWEGEVVCMIEITYSETMYEKTVIQSGGTQSPAKDVFQEYTFTYNVLPYPELDRDTKTSEYHLRLVVNKK